MVDELDKIGRNLNSINRILFNENLHIVKFFHNDSSRFAQSFDTGFLYCYGVKFDDVGEDSSLVINKLGGFDGIFLNGVLRVI